MLEGEAGGAPEASLLAEIRVTPGHEFYDFDAKYLDDVLRVRHPGRPARAVTRQVQEYARRTFTALDCPGWPGSTSS